MEKLKILKQFGIWTRVIAIVLCLSMGTSVYATTIDDIKMEQSQTQANLNQVTGQISGLQGEQQGVQNEISELDTQLIDLMTSIDVLESEIAHKEEEIIVATQEYEAAKLEEAKQYEAMKARVRFMYEQGDTTYLQLFFMAESIGDMINKVDYITQVYDYDRLMLEEFQIAKEAVEQARITLIEEQSELETNQIALEEEKQVLSILLNEKKQVAKDYEVQIANMRQTASAYTAQIKQQNAEIKKLEEEAAKKAAEEAAKREEEAKKEEASNGSSGNANGGGDSDSNSGSNPNSGSTADPGSTSNPGSTSTPDSNSNTTGGSVTGQAIADYACKFIGNPYVLGGTSLTNGADCSGFTQAVYKAFGYNISRTSTQQRGDGRGVSYSEAQPGDLICYAGHVALYIGNGKIVHASTPATGIKYGTATYREILAVRRII